MSLVVTADDLGLSRAVTKGVLEAHQRGIVRSTSQLVTFPWSEEGADFASTWARHQKPFPDGRVTRREGTRMLLEDGSRSDHADIKHVLIG